jgi:putative heme-binding domain-containing protein
MKTIVAGILLTATAIWQLPNRDILGHIMAAQEPQESPAASDDAAQKEDKEPVVRPRVFLDKPERIVWYQLNRLNNDQLLLVERKTNDAMYAPVYLAILTRPGMTGQNREQALEGLVELRTSNSITELLAAFDSLPDTDKGGARVGRQLAALVLRQPKSELQSLIEEITKEVTAESSLLRSTCLAALVVAGESQAAQKIADSDNQSCQDYLRAIGLIPNKKTRLTQRTAIVLHLKKQDDLDTRRAAIRALSQVITPEDNTFALATPLIHIALLRDATVKTMLAVDAKSRPTKEAKDVLDFLVGLAESTPTADRTTDPFIDAMQLADQLLAAVPVELARQYRARLREVSVRVVRIKTIEEEMRYDTPYFAVEAGRSVQVVLQNEDLMPHNFVITAPDALQEVALLGATLPKGQGDEARQYVPDMPQVLFATDMVPARQQARLTFKAPTEPGEYPFVCTFPRHWMRMYGVMVVVADLDEWLKNPIEPKDPVGSNRSFVQAWKIEDFEDDLEAALRGRTFEIGERLFAEATCALCHKMNGMGGAVGPELTDALKRWKGDRLGVLREILDPSHKIDPKYSVQVIYTVDGLVVSGIVKAEDKSSISILENLEAKEPMVIDKDDIDEQVRSSKSMMPKALLDRFSRDEILEVLSYIEHAHEHKHHHHNHKNH